MAKMTFNEFVKRAKRAPKKNLIMAGSCAVAAVALTIYYFVVVIL